MKGPNLPVPDGLFTSATRMQSYEDCPRLWWYNAHLPDGLPATEAMARGTAVHEVIAGFLLTGEWPAYKHTGAPDAVPIAQAGERLLLPLRDAVVAGKAYVEAPFVAEVGPIPFTGTIDFYADDMAPPGVRLGAHWGPTVLDHKTTSDLGAPWHLDEAGMRRNTQLLLYAAHAWKRIPDSVHIGHLYYVTKGLPASRDLIVTVTRAEIETAREIACRRSEDMLRLWHAPERKVPVRTSACTKYGGCPHRATCPDSPINQRAAIAAHIEGLRAQHRNVTMAKVPPAVLSPVAPKATAPKGARSLLGPRTQGAGPAIRPSDAAPTAEQVAARLSSLRDKGARVDAAYIARVCAESGVDEALVAGMLNDSDIPDPSDADAGPEDTGDAWTLGNLAAALVVELYNAGCLPGTNKARTTDTLSETLNEPPERIVDAVNAGNAAMSPLFRLQKDTLQLAFLPASVDDVNEVTAYLNDLEDAPAPQEEAPPARPTRAPAPAAPKGAPVAPSVDNTDPERAALLVELERLEKVLSKEVRDGIKAKVQVERPRRAGTDRLQAYVHALIQHETEAGREGQARPAAPAPTAPVAQKKGAKVINDWIVARLTQYPHTPLTPKQAATVLQVDVDSVSNAVMRDDRIDVDHGNLVLSQPAAQPAATTPRAPAPAAPKAPTARDTHAASVVHVRPMVLLGCFLTEAPGDTGAMTIEEWASDLIARLDAEEAGPLIGRPYLDGPKALASAVRAALLAGSLRMPNFLVVPTNHPYGEYVVSALLSHYGDTVRVVRAG